MKERQEYITPPGFFTEAYARLAEQVSMIPCPPTIQVAHASLKPIVRVLYSHDGTPQPEIKVQPKTDNLLGMDLPQFLLWDDRPAMLGFSGGKDSVAMAIKLMNEGKKVTAFHVQNLNKSCTDEKQASIDTCRLLGIPLVIKAVKTHGPTTRLESPVKNLLVLAMMLDHGGTTGIQNYAVGTQVDRPNGTDGFSSDMDFSDAPDVLFIGSELFRQVPEFTLRAAELGDTNIDMYYSIKLVLSHKNGWKLLEASRSCMTQFRFKKMRKIANEKKYKVKLLPGRCGSCWKCCVEYVILDAMGKVKKNNAFLKKCWDFIHSKKLTHWEPVLDQMLIKARRESRK